LDNDRLGHLEPSESLCTAAKVLCARFGALDGTPTGRLTHQPQLEGAWAMPPRLNAAS
jgi:hypothetical protein